MIFSAVFFGGRLEQLASALSAQRAAMARQSCSRSSQTKTMIAFQWRRGSVSASLLANTRLSGKRF